MRSIFCTVAILLLCAAVARSPMASELGALSAEIADAAHVTAANQQIPAAGDSIASEYERLGLEYEKLDAARDEKLPNDSNEAADTSLSDDEWLEYRRAEQSKAPNPDALLPQFLAFAKNRAESPLAFDAIFFVVRKSGFQEFRGDGKPSPALLEALDLAWKDHKDDPRIVHLLQLLAIPSRQSEIFLMRAMDDAPNQAVRAAATYHLARYYRILAGCHKKTQQIEADSDQSKLTNEQRIWKLVVVPNLEKYLPLDDDENSKRINLLLNQVVADFSDVPSAAWTGHGPGNIYVETAPLAAPKTYGDEAAAILYEMKYLSPGNTAPEIVGQDADCKTFRLSDYHDQVVLLTFSADWCPSCVKLYPIERRLQEKFRGQPFVILSVNCDESIETLKSSIAEGDITWRCWWDGRSGPIRTAWNTGLPGIHLLDDKHILQDTDLGPNNTVEEFERAIAPLVEKAAARNEPAAHTDCTNSREETTVSTSEHSR